MSAFLCSSTAPLLCPHCDHSHIVEEVSGSPETCGRCGEKMPARTGWDFSSCLAITLAALIFCVLSNLYPIITFDVQGLKQSNLLITGVIGLHYQGYELVAALVMLCSILAPSLRLFFLAYVLAGCLAGKSLPAMGRACAWAGRLKPWSLVEVYAVALVVASARLELLGEVEFEIGAIFVVALFVLSLLLDQMLNEEELWEEIRQLRDGRGPLHFDAFPGLRWTGCSVCGCAVPFRPGEETSACPRCGAGTKFRRGEALQNTWALVLAGLIFYVPANVLTVMDIVVTGDLQHLTILGGVEELYSVGLGPVALIVFFASIMVPFLKLAGLSWIMLFLNQAEGRPGRAKLFRYIHVFGRWSMVDIFLLSVLVAVGQLGVLASVDAKPGALYFCLVFLCTVFAVNTFDRRLIWDEAAAAVPENGEAEKAGA